MQDFNNYLSDKWVHNNSITIDKSWKSVLKKIEINSKKIISIDGDYSVDWKKTELIIRKSLSNNKNIIFLSFYECMCSYQKLNLFFNKNFLDKDSLFGKVSKCNIDKLLEKRKTFLFIKEFKKIFKKKDSYDCMIVIGPGINSLSINNYFDTKFYINLSKINSLMKNNWSNIGKTQTVSPNLFYYFIFPIMEKYQKKILKKTDYYVENKKDNNFQIITTLNLFKILSKISKEPLKLYPIYEPGVWGGKWLTKKRKLNIKNCAIGMELIGQEQNILIKFNNDIIEIPFPLMMTFEGENILGKVNSLKYKNYFPVRVAYDDTFNNKDQNLSIQVHPDKFYIKKFFNEPLAQAEMYYIADQSKKSKVFLGFKKNISSKEFKKEIEYSAKTSKKINYERFINSIVANKGDLFLIPPGTVHAAGSGNFVLEISNTPYRYTFKIYDYCRLNTDGKKRKLSLEHAFNVLNYNADSKWVNKNLRPEPRLFKVEKNYSEYLLSDHKSFTFNLFRIHFKNYYDDKTSKSMHVINLIKGNMIFLVNEEKNIKVKLSLSETLLIPKKFGNYKILSFNNKEFQIIKVVLK